MRTTATLHTPVSVPLLRAALDDAGPGAAVTIEGVGATARLLVQQPEATTEADGTAATPAGFGG